jgi:hypothetical protein
MYFVKSMFKRENTMAVDLPAPRMHPTVLHLFPQRKLLFSLVEIFRKASIANKFACTVCGRSISCTVKWAGNT